MKYKYNELKKIRELAVRSKINGETITLLCKCKNKDRCRRSIVKEFIERQEEEKLDKENNNSTLTIDQLSRESTRGYIRTNE